MSYSNPPVCTYRFPAATLSSAATVGRLIGPAGMQGRLVDIATVVTTGVTVAACTVTAGTEADVDAYGSHTVPVSAANAGKNGVTLTSTVVLPANTVVAIAAGGECTAGAGDILVTINWY